MNKPNLHEEMIIWPGYETQKPKGIKISSHLKVVIYLPPLCICIHHVSKNAVQNCFCQNFTKFPSIIIFLVGI